jgi:flavodoxin
LTPAIGEDRNKFIKDEDTDDENNLV